MRVEVLITGVNWGDLQIVSCMEKATIEYGPLLPTCTPNSLLRLNRNSD